MNYGKYKELTQDKTVYFCKGLKKYSIKQEYSTTTIENNIEVVIKIEDQNYIINKYKIKRQNIYF